MQGMLKQTAFFQSITAGGYVQRADSKVKPTWQRICWLLFLLFPEPSGSFWQVRFPHCGWANLHDGWRFCHQVLGKKNLLTSDQNFVCIAGAQCTVHSLGKPKHAFKAFRFLTTSPKLMWNRVIKPGSLWCWTFITKRFLKLCRGFCPKKIITRSLFVFSWGQYQYAILVICISSNINLVLKHASSKDNVSTLQLLISSSFRDSVSKCTAPKWVYTCISCIWCTLLSGSQ